MQSAAATPEEYIQSLPEDRREAVTRLRDAIRSTLPEGFSEGMGSGMLCYSVPHSLYPAGYHCNPKQPLPFLSIASQKNFIALYHMGLYGNKPLLDWFVAAYPQHCRTKLDMGKGCVRFKKVDDIPYALIAELMGRMTPEQWISCYEENLKASRK